MKTKTPRARVLHEYASGAQYAKPLPGTHPVVLIPVSTGNPKQDAAQARQIVKAAPFLMLSDDEQHELIADAAYQAYVVNRGTKNDVARAVLATINGGKTK